MPRHQPINAQHVTSAILRPSLPASRVSHRQLPGWGFGGRGAESRERAACALEVDRVDEVRHWRALGLGAQHGCLRQGLRRAVGVSGGPSASCIAQGGGDIEEHMSDVNACVYICV